MKTPEEGSHKLVIQGLSQGNRGLYITRSLLLAWISAMDMDLTMMDTDLLLPSQSSESSISCMAALCNEMTLFNENQGTPKDNMESHEASVAQDTSPVPSG